MRGWMACSLESHKTSDSSSLISYSQTSISSTLLFFPPVLCDLPTTYLPTHPHPLTPCPFCDSRQPRTDVLPHGWVVGSTTYSVDYRYVTAARAAWLRLRAGWLLPRVLTRARPRRRLGTRSVPFAACARLPFPLSATYVTTAPSSSFPSVFTVSPLLRTTTPPARGRFSARPVRAVGHARLLRRTLACGRAASSILHDFTAPLRQRTTSSPFTYHHRCPPSVPASQTTVSSPHIARRASRIHRCNAGCSAVAALRVALLLLLATDYANDRTPHAFRSFGAPTIGWLHTALQFFCTPACLFVFAFLFALHYCVCPLFFLYCGLDYFLCLACHTTPMPFCTFVCLAWFVWWHFAHTFSHCIFGGTFAVALQLPGSIFVYLPCIPGKHLLFSFPHHTPPHTPTLPPVPSLPLPLPTPQHLP